MSTEVWADWCESDEAFAICGTRMKEYSRRSEGVHWCFRCRRRVEFEWVVMAPDGLSYYGPTAHMECTNCKSANGDLFPGWTRESEDES
jgi:hypothetical protein